MNELRLSPENKFGFVIQDMAKVHEALIKTLLSLQPLNAIERLQRKLNRKHGMVSN